MKKYIFRGLPCTNKNWCIESNYNGSYTSSGIQEWCRSEYDAENMLKHMIQYTEFSNLTIKNLEDEISKHG